MTSRADFFSNHQWTGGVVGIGYVGLPLATAIAARGHPVIGFDVSPQRVAQLMQGVSPIEDVSDAELQEALQGGLTFTTDAAALKQADALFLCVPSPLGRNREPDLSYIRAAAETVAAVVQPGMLVSLESTTYPGTTEDILVPAATSSGLVLDEDVFVAFSPERVNPGSDIHTAQIPKVVGGVTAASTAVAVAAYARIVDSVHPVSTAKTAEMAKLLENTYRAVNIGLVNEMAMLAHELGIDIWEVIAAASSKPFGYQPFFPGPGVGGHCIPLDPQFLAWRAREANFAVRFVDLAEQINTRMPRYSADRITDLLNSAGKAVFGSRVLGVGISYKPDIADSRESASLEVLSILARRGATIRVLDPLVMSDVVAQFGHGWVDPLGSYEGHDIAVILTDHSTLDLQRIAESVPMVFDTRGAYRRAGLDYPHVEAL